MSGFAGLKPGASTGRICQLRFHRALFFFFFFFFFFFSRRVHLAIALPPGRICQLRFHPGASVSCASIERIRQVRLHQPRLLHALPPTAVDTPSGSAYLISFMGSSDPYSVPPLSTARAITDAKASRNSGYFATIALITAMLSWKATAEFAAWAFW